MAEDVKDKVWVMADCQIQKAEVENDEAVTGVVYHTKHNHIQYCRFQNHFVVHEEYKQHTAEAVDLIEDAKVFKQLCFREKCLEGLLECTYLPIKFPELFSRRNSISRPINILIFGPSKSGKNFLISKFYEKVLYIQTLIDFSNLL